MQQYNREIALTNALSRISTATKIDNFTRSSIPRLIAQSNALDVEMAINNTNESLKQFYILTATGRFLDTKAYEMGLSRNILDKIIVFASDEALRLEVLTEGTTFGDYLQVGQNSFLAGTILATLSNSYKITLLENITLNLAQSYQFVSVKIEPLNPQITEDAVFNINEGQVIILDPNFITNKLQLRSVKPIVIETQNESDDQLRARLLEAKADPVEGTPEAISSILRSIPNLLGFSIQQNIRNDNSIDFYLVTKALIENTNFQFLPIFINNLAQDKLPVNTDVQVKFPKKLELYIEYKTGTTEVVPSETIKSVLQNVINTHYIYNQTNFLPFKQIEDSVKAILQELKTFTITKISGLDLDILEYVIVALDDVLIPINYYCYVSTIDQLTNVNV